MLKCKYVQGGKVPEHDDVSFPGQGKAKDQEQNKTVHAKGFIISYSSVAVNIKHTFISQKRVNFSMNVLMQSKKRFQRNLIPNPPLLNL